jgi:hypothetical protein
VHVFGRKVKQNALARVAEQDSVWLRDSRLRQLFDADLEDGERILHICEATATSASFDRPVTGWVITTDRALRMRWGFGTAVRQSLHIGYDRIRWVEVATADPQDAHVRYFDAARPTVGWYQDLRLRADTAELAQALPHLVSAHQGRIVRQVEAPEQAVDATQVAGIPAQRHSVATEDVVAPAARSRVAAGAHKRRRLLARR